MRLTELLVINVDVAVAEVIQVVADELGEVRLEGHARGRPARIGGHGAENGGVDCGALGYEDGLAERGGEGGEAGARLELGRGIGGEREGEEDQVLGEGRRGGGCEAMEMPFGEEISMCVDEDLGRG